MGWWIMAALIVLGALTPVRLDVRILVTEKPRWQVRAALWGRPLPVLDSARLPRPTHPRPKLPPAKTLLAALRASGAARETLAQRIHLRVMVCGRINAADAARAALVSGLLNSLVASLPLAWKKQLRVQVLPNFGGGATRFQLRGIAAFRLGTIIAGTVALAAALARARHNAHAMKEAA